jgi:thiosulfate reductase cytochrome b subunit
MEFPLKIQRVQHNNNGKDEVKGTAMSELARFLIIAGVLLVVVGLALLLAPKIPWLGKLPGDFTWQRGNFTFYLPLGTCILISLVLTLLFFLFRK